MVLYGVFLGVGLVVGRAESRLNQRLADCLLADSVAYVHGLGRLADISGIQPAIPSICT